MDRKLVRGILGAVMAVGLSGAPVLASPSVDNHPPKVTFACIDGIYYQYLAYGELQSTSFDGDSLASNGFIKMAIGTCGGAVASVRGTAFEDKNANGKRDAGEPTMSGAWGKITGGGSWFACFYTGSDATYAIPVVEVNMTYIIFPIAPMGWKTTTPVIKTKTVNTANGFAFLFNDMGFVRDASVKTVEGCDQYNPSRPVPPGL
jgi:hypothetical protein